MRVVFNYRDVKALHPVYKKYGEADKLLDDKKYDEALGAFMELSSYKDNGAILNECRYRKAAELLDAQNYAGAKELLEDIGDYKDSKVLMRKIENIFRTAQAGTIVYATGQTEGFWVAEAMPAYEFIDTTGKEVIPLVYDEGVTSFKNGFARVV